MINIKKFIILDSYRLKNLILTVLFLSIIFFFQLFLRQKINLNLFFLFTILFSINYLCYILYFNLEREKKYFPIYPLILFYYLITFTAYFYFDQEEYFFIESEVIIGVIITLSLGLFFFSLGYFLPNLFYKDKNDIIVENIDKYNGLVILGSYIILIFIHVNNFKGYISFSFLNQLREPLTLLIVVILQLKYFEKKSLTQLFLNIFSISILFFIEFSSGSTVFPFLIILMVTAINYFKTKKLNLINLSLICYSIFFFHGIKTEIRNLNWVNNNPVILNDLIKDLTCHDLLSDKKLSELFKNKELNNLVNDKKISELYLDKKFNNLLEDKKLCELYLDKELNAALNDKKIIGLYKEEATKPKVLEVVTEPKVLEVVTEPKVLEVVTEAKVLEVVTEAKVLEVVTEAKVLEVVTEAKVLEIIKDKISNDLLNNIKLSELHKDRKLSELLKNKKIKNSYEEEILQDLIKDKTIVTNLYDTYKIVKTSSISEEKIINSKSLHYLQYRFFHSNITLQRAIELTPHAVKFLNGKSYESIIYKPIPRFIYKNKPHEEWGNYYGKLYKILNAEDFSTSWNFPILSEFFSNFGLKGVIFGMLILGLSTKVLIFFTHSYNKSILISSMSYVVIFNLAYQESNLTQSIGKVINQSTLFLCLIFFILIVNICIRKFKDEN